MKSQTVSVRLIATLTGLALLVAGCAPAATSAPTPQPTATPPPSTATVVPTPVPPTATAQPTATAAWQTFVSTRYGYKVAFPPLWQSADTDGKWWADGFPGIGSPGVDTFAAPDANVNQVWYYVYITVAAHPLASGESLETWAARFPTTFNDAGFDCAPAEPTTKIQIGKEPAILSSDDCQVNAHTSNTYQYKFHAAMVTHNGQGFAVVMRNPTDTAQADLMTFQAFWSSLVFTK